MDIPPPRFVIEYDDIALLRRFTAYMELIVTHAGIDYVRCQAFRKLEIALGLTVTNDNVDFDEIPINSHEFDFDEFDFEEKRLADAFFQLSHLRKRIITLLYVEGLSPQETAERLNCSVDYVYKQKHRALKKLRDQLMNGGEKCGK